jgi:phosphatidylserine decarboxylase
MSMPMAVRVQHLLPQRMLCAFIYFVSRCRVRWFKNLLISWFARQYRVDLDEARQSEPADYASFNAFFTRALRDGARRIDSRAGAIVSPADGRLTQIGTINNDRLIQAKGFEYSLAELLGESARDVETFDAGITATIYLAPHDYHRVHTPAAGRLVAMRYIAGRRFSVNATTAQWISRLYCRNERLVCWFEADFGRYAVVLVGALNVSSISTTMTGEIRSGRDFYLPELSSGELARGEEFARFNLGSTVVLAMPRGTAEFISDAQPGRSVRVGECIATTAAATLAQ